MKLNPAQLEQTLTQFEAQVIPDDHPLVPKLHELFGDHTSFLATAMADGITVNVPVSNYVFGLSMNLPFNPNTYVTQLQYVEGIFNQVYPNWQSGGTEPNPDISMWTIGNEPDNSGGNITPAAVAAI